MSKDYIMLIIAAVCFVVYIVVSIILGKKINVKDFTCIKSFILEVLPSIINATEDKVDGSAQKKETVVSAAVLMVKEQFGTIKKRDLDKIIQFTSRAVEDILSTPQKKEAING